MVDALWYGGDPVPTPDGELAISKELNGHSYNQTYSQEDGITQINATRFMRSNDSFDYNVTCEKNIELTWMANTNT